MADANLPSAFTGIRVLDFTQAQQGPFATLLLADMGADVIKVEPPGGEMGRANGLGPDGFSSYFEGHNRGKRSLTLDFKKPGALEVARRLVPTVDVVVENFRPGVMERLGLGFDDLRALKPDIIMASASAWGREGPWAKRGGYDHVAQALSGVMYEQGEGPGGEPQALIGGFADQVGAMLLAFGIASALFVRERDGIGQHIDGSLIGGMVAMQSKQVMEFLRTGKQSGFERRRAATYTNYECSDGKHVAIAANTQEMWERLCDALEAPELKADPRFEEPFGRARHKDELVAELDRRFRRKSQANWLGPLDAHDVPHAPVLDYAGMSEHPQYWANGYLQEIDTPHLGRMRVPGPPLHMSATPPRVQGAGPILGFHTEEILLEAGFSWDEIEALREAGATRMA
ncbi:MAG: CoA transferase [Dehalococcoidia bacterium]|nr:CoA transferase [Dehalococcoidia bacterium]MCB9486983.1 CoA transferase [Thermoflexaceae bacterium]